jgi:hypothetical protein
VSYTVTWTNPAVGVKRELVYETRREAEERVEKYERKYGTFPGYERATIASTRNQGTKET